MAEPNWKNRTLWTGDNLPLMRGLNSASVDLIYLDAPTGSHIDAFIQDCRRINQPACAQA